MTDPAPSGRAAVRGYALVRPPVDDLDRGIVTHVERRPVDVDLARTQHARYCAALSAAGWSVREVAAAPEHPDSVFVEDAVVVVDDVAVLTRTGAEERRGELAGVEQAVAELGLQVRRIGPAGTLDGGDVLQVGRTVYVGRGGRTDAEGVRALRALLEPLGRTVVPVRLRDVLHLKSAVTALPDDTLIGNGALVERSAFPTWREAEEAEGAHVVPVGGGRLVMAASAPRTAAALADLGFDVVPVDIGEFEKLEGCVTCLTVLVPRPAA